MRNLKRLFRLLPHLLLWLLASALLWSWIFNFLTDTDRDHKITLFIGMQSLQDRTLAVALEEDLPDGIRMVQVHPFDYALMDSVSLETADLYIMTEGQAREHRDWLCPLPEGLDPSPGMLELDGETVGLRIYAAKEDTVPGAGVAASYLNYMEMPGEDWFLCFGRGGYHLAGLENGLDSASLAVAGRLLTLE